MQPSRKDVSRNALGPGAKFADVLERLNRGVFGVVFILDAHARLIGLYTDGDVRRAVLAGGGLEDSAEQHMQRNFVCGDAEATHEHNVGLLDDRIRHLPIVDAQRHLVDFLSWAEMWRQPVMEPSLGGNELKYVSDCITSSWISSRGHYVGRFEQAFAAYHGVEHALTTTNGTSALHLALVGLGIGPGDEVIVPALTFAATANAVVHAGATPVIVDVSAEHWTLDPAAVRRHISARTKALLPVHLYGHPCPMTELMAIAREHELLVIEDCAEALGARYQGERVGTFGDAACFSFFSNKIITTGEGGMVLTRSDTLRERLRLLRDHGMSTERRYWHEVVGFNYRMTNLQAAVGLAQMEQIDGFLERKRAGARRYLDALACVPGVVMPPQMPWASNVYWLFSILIEPRDAGLDRDELVGYLEREGVETRRLFHPLNVMPPYRSSQIPCPVAESLAARGLSLPSSTSMTETQIDDVCRLIAKRIRHSKVMKRVENH